MSRTRTRTRTRTHLCHLIFSFSLVASRFALFGFAGCTTGGPGGTSGNSESSAAPGSSSSLAPSVQTGAVQLTQAQLNQRTRLYVPSEAPLKAPLKAKKSPATPRPLLVVIHGCAQNIEQMADGTKLTAEAEKQNFSVLFVGQEPGRHPVNCWQWWEPGNHGPAKGELGEILAMIEDAKKKTPVDTQRIVVAGLSSGSATASALLACHPNVFAGGALHSGPAFAIAKSSSEAMERLREGPPETPVDFPQGCDPKKYRGRLLIVQGSKDAVVNPRHADTLVTQFVGKDASGELRGREVELSLDQMGTLKTETVCHGDPLRVCLVNVEGLPHAWSGGARQIFFDPRGFSANELISKFLISGDLPYRQTARDSSK